jgi:hypothetical protein
VSRLLAGSALAAFLVAMLIVTVVSATSGDDGTTTAATTAPRTTVPRRPTRPTTTAPAAPKTRPLELTGAGAYDPYGDEHENDDLAPLAVDGDPATAWETEHYLRGFSKPGVGLLLDAGRRLPIAKVVVRVDAPGAAARIDLGDSATGPFEPASVERRLNGRTAFPLTKGAAGRYIVVWLTVVPEPANESHITEVQAETTSS